jgi:hypothetical protein
MYKDIYTNTYSARFIFTFFKISSHFISETSSGQYEKMYLHHFRNTISCNMTFLDRKDDNSFKIRTYEFLCRPRLNFVVRNVNYIIYQWLTVFHKRFKLKIDFTICACVHACVGVCYTFNILWWFEREFEVWDFPWNTLYDNVFNRNRAWYKNYRSCVQKIWYYIELENICQRFEVRIEKPTVDQI